MNEMDAFGAIMIGMGAFVFFFSLIGIVLYVLGAVWEMKFLQKVGYDKAWFAWIPFCNFIAMGEVAFSADVQEVEADIIHKPFPTWVFKFFTLLLVAVNVVLGWIPVLGSLTFIVDILAYIAFYGPIMRAIAKKFNTEITGGRCVLDSIITLVSFYDVYTWSNKYQYNPYANLSDVAGSQQFDYSGFEQPNANNPYMQNNQQGFVQPTQNAYDNNSVEQNISDFVNEQRAEESDLPKEF